MLDHMFHLPLPILEKILRPILVYLVLIVLLRVFGKRELAQLNPFDLVVLLSLSNTVQNAIIGDDNSVTGGAIGALTLLSVNWLVVWMLDGSPKMNRTLGGTARVLIANGVIDRRALRKELLTEEELLAVVRRQGFDNINDVVNCVLEPNGVFFVEGGKPTPDESRQQELLARIELLTLEVRALRSQVGAAE
jgi:uncharacterized membrane protein YcaP (DUF421 family)